VSFDNPFDDLEKAEEEARQERQQRRPQRGPYQFDEALEQVTARDVAKAARKKTFQGKYWLRTLRLPPEYQDLTREIYQQEVRARSLAEIERWIYTMGLIAYFQEGKRPQYNETISRDIDLPEV
jgi:predicted Zn-dependent peptidase